MIHFSSQAFVFLVLIVTDSKSSSRLWGAPPICSAVHCIKWTFGQAGLLYHSNWGHSIARHLNQQTKFTRSPRTLEEDPSKSESVSVPKRNRVKDQSLTTSTTTRLHGEHDLRRLVIVQVCKRPIRSSRLVDKLRNLSSATRDTAKPLQSAPTEIGTSYSV